jgi:hypothetical protein
MRFKFQDIFIKYEAGFDKTDPRIIKYYPDEVVYHGKSAGTGFSTFAPVWPIIKLRKFFANMGGIW